MNDIRYLSIRQIVEESKYPFTLPMMRHYLLHRHKNGLESAVRKIGKRLFIREDLFMDWIEAQKGGNNG
jgi:hypothetical protein